MCSDSRKLDSFNSRNYANLPLSELVTLLSDTPFVVILTSHYIEAKLFKELDILHNRDALVNALVYTASLHRAYSLLVGLRRQGLMTGLKQPRSVRQSSTLSLAVVLIDLR